MPCMQQRWAFIPAVLLPLLRDPTRAYRSVLGWGEARVSLLLTSGMYFHPRRFFNILTQRHIGLKTAQRAIYSLSRLLLAQQPSSLSSGGERWL